MLVFSLLSATAVSAEETATAIFASGCFWCTEKDFEEVPGVLQAVSGYIDGHVKNPSYRQVSSGTTGHTEAVKVFYDAKLISYEQLLKVYWYSVDPFARDRQFCDTGTQYRSGIYYKDDEQRKAAILSKKELIKRHSLTTTIHTEIKKAGQFWDAEDYHQGYYKENPVRYKFYRFNCGRDQRLEKLWKENAGWKPAK